MQRERKRWWIRRELRKNGKKIEAQSRPACLQPLPEPSPPLRSPSFKPASPTLEAKHMVFPHLPAFYSPFLSRGPGFPQCSSWLPPFFILLSLGEKKIEHMLLMWSWLFFFPLFYFSFILSLENNWDACYVAAVTPCLTSPSIPSSLPSSGDQLWPS